MAVLINRKNVFVMGALFAFSSFSIAGGDAEAGKAKSVSCVACHGEAGMSNAPNYPNLACQKEMYLSKQLKDFKSGARKDPLMENFVKPLNAKDIDNLAAYYSQLPCK